MVPLQRSVLFLSPTYRFFSGVLPRPLTATPRHLPQTHEQLEKNKMEVGFDGQLQSRRVFVRKAPSEQKLLINFYYSDDVMKKPHLFTFLRDNEDRLGTTLERMSIKLSDRINAKLKQSKSKRQKKMDAQFDAQTQAETKEASFADALPFSKKITLRSDDGVLSEELANEVAWRDGVEMLLDDVVYRVYVNLPQMTGKITKCILPDFPVDASLNFEFADEEESVFLWFKSAHKSGVDSPLSFDKISNKHGHWISGEYLRENFKSILLVPAKWELISTDRDWKPTREDVGLFLALICFPIRRDQIGQPVAIASTNPVADALPENVPFRRRHESCHRRTSLDSFRVVSYNLLADVYADQESTHRDLFPYCPPERLKIDFRRQLILSELVGYNSDIMCLQEVDVKVFNDYYEPQLLRKGFQGLMRRKRDTINEGVAMFFRTDRFRLVEQFDLEMSKAFWQDEYFKEWADKINERALFTQVLKERSSPLQLTLLADINDCSRLLLIANTHLWYRPEFPRVRLVQIGVVLRHMERIFQHVKLKHGLVPAVMLCGDLNSTSGWGVHHFLNNGKIPTDFPEWNMFCKEESEYARLELQHPFRFFSACGQPEFTNYTSGFKAAIDWIYADADRLKTTFVIPFPTEEELSRFIALPSIHFPSDHIAIGCDLQWQ